MPRSPTAVRIWVRSRCDASVTLDRSPTSSVCEGSRDAKLDVCGAGTQVILSAKSETFWCLMSIPMSPCWARDRAWENREGNELGEVVSASPTLHRTPARTAACTSRSLREPVTERGCQLSGGEKPPWCTPGNCASIHFRKRLVIKHVRSCLVDRIESPWRVAGWSAGEGETPVVAAAMSRWQLRGTRRER